MKHLLSGGKRRLAAAHPAHALIAKGALAVASFVLLGKAFGALKEMALAWRYGAGQVTDAFQVTVTLVQWAPTTLSSMLSLVLVPLIVRLRKQDDLPSLAEILGQVQGLAVTVGGILTLGYLLVAFALTHVTSVSRAVDPYAVGYFVSWGAATVPITMLIGVQSCRLMSSQRQTNSLLEAVPAAILLPFVVLWPLGQRLEPLALGMICGAAVQGYLVSRAATKADGLPLKLSFRLTSPHWRELFRAGGVVLLGQSLLSLVTPLDQFFAARVGEGSIASLSYATRVTALVLGVGATAVARAALPVIASLRASDSVRQVLAITLRWSVLLFIVGAGITAIGWYLAPDIVKLLFERGQFNAADTARVSALLRYSLLQTPFYFSGLVLVQVLAVFGRFRFITISAIATLIVKVAFNAALANTMGITGIALATSFMYAFSFCVLLYGTNRLTRL